jgi:hypothetical protein
MGIGRVKENRYLYQHIGNLRKQTKQEFYLLIVSLLEPGAEG